VNLILHFQVKVIQAHHLVSEDRQHRGSASLSNREDMPLTSRDVQARQFG
jgi:hypothetical protein